MSRRYSLFAPAKRALVSGFCCATIQAITVATASGKWLEPSTLVTQTQEPGAGADEAEPLVRRKFRTFAGMTPVLHWNATGGFDVGARQTIETMVRGLHTFYCCEETVRELELTEVQEREYMQIVRSWDNGIKVYLNGLKKHVGESDEASRARWQDNQKALQKIERESLKAIDELLLDHQRDFLEQLQFRFLVRSQGPRSALQDQEILDALGLDLGELFRALEMPEETRNELIRRVNELLAKSIDELLKGFDETQRKAIVAKWPQLAGNDAAYAEIMRIHCLMSNEFETLRKFSTVFERVLYFPGIELSTAGLYKLAEQTFSFGEDVENSAIMFLYPPGIPDAQASRLDKLDLSADQEILIELGRERQFKATVRYRGETNSPGPDAESRDSATKEFYQLIRATLSEKQWRQLEEMAQTELESRMGPVADLMFGTLGKQLKLTDEQKNRVKEAAGKAREVYESGTIAIEEWWIDSILARLPDNAATKLKEMLGPQPKNIPANLHAWLPQERQ